MPPWLTGDPYGMEQKAINLKTLTMDELAGVVNLYPWYGAARKELCVRMAGLGGESWGVGQFADQAMYIGNRSAVADILRSGSDNDYSDADIEKLVSSYINEEKRPEKTVIGNRPARIAGGDFFSQTEYEQVRREEDNVFSRFQIKKKSVPGDAGEDLSMEFCTETLAGIYAEQGYFEQARRIYGKLILAFPEKSAYFASLIENLDKLINNQTL